MYGFSCLLRRCGAVDLVRTNLDGGNPARHADAAVGGQDGSARKIPFFLLRSQAVQQILIHAERDHGSDAVTLILRELALDVGGRVVGGRNRRALRKAQMAVAIYDCGHNCLPREIQDLGSRVA